ncbi:hypothetical protein A2U01_0061260 [Trifolium medium]|uniref:Uncharacterized protein n=1 Tax=Trifolium medium TaxID=97028 RepID=A0A392RTR1_9FABA|nr:hypothetical protein [Trifolium medium]
MSKSERRITQDNGGGSEAQRRKRERCQKLGDGTESGDGLTY